MPRLLTAHLQSTFPSSFAQRNINKYAGFHVLTVFIMKSSIFWDTMLCIRKKAGRALLVTCFHTGFLPVLVFDPEAGGNMFLQNFGQFFQ
jgi:hypothetical protein